MVLPKMPPPAQWPTAGGISKNMDKVFKSHIQHLHPWNLHWRGELPKRMALKTNQAYIQETQRAVGNWPSSLEGQFRFTCSKTQHKSSKLVSAQNICEGDSKASLSRDASVDECHFCTLFLLCWCCLSFPCTLLQPYLTTYGRYMQSTQRTSLECLALLARGSVFLGPVGLKQLESYWQVTTPKTLNRKETKIHPQFFCDHPLKTVRESFSLSKYKKNSESQAK